MRVEQPHMSIKIKNPTGIELLKSEIEEAQKIADKLSKSKESIQAFLERQNIDEEVTNKKLLALSKKIEQLYKIVQELSHIVEVHSDNDI